MHEIFRGLDFCFVYKDDILVVSTSEEEHLHHLEVVFSRPKDKGILVNTAICVFRVIQAEFLGILTFSLQNSPVTTKIRRNS